jgi:hypothetical protein
MPNFETTGEGKVHLKAVLERLVTIGWIERLIVNDATGDVAVVWTAKGAQRATQFLETVCELRGGEADLLALTAICHAHLPSGKPSK